jgi:predicted secreted Zn-dependent protease
MFILKMKNNSFRTQRLSLSPDSQKRADQFTRTLEKHEKEHNDNIRKLTSNTSTTDTIMQRSSLKRGS